MKFYPASLAYLGQNKEKYEHLFKKETSDNGGCIELTVGGAI